MDMPQEIYRRGDGKGYKKIIEVGCLHDARTEGPHACTCHASRTEILSRCSVREPSV
jgi:hypothetical protein